MEARELRYFLYTSDKNEFLHIVCFHYKSQSAIGSHLMFNFLCHININQASNSTSFYEITSFINSKHIKLFIK